MGDVVRRAAYGLAVLALASGCTVGGTGTGEIVPRSAPESESPTEPPSASPTGPPPAVDVPEETHTGTHAGQFAVSWPADQLGFFTFDCPKCAANVIITTDGGEFSLVNAIGKYHGTTWLNTDPGRPTRTVTVVADAPWTATIQDRRSVPAAEAGKDTSGKGDAVLKIPEGVTHGRSTARTRGHVALWSLAGRYPDLLVNEIGDQQAEKELRGPAYVKVEGYESSWTLTAS